MFRYRKMTLQEHRERGRGRRAFWILVGIAAVVMLIGILPGFSHGGHRRGHDVDAAEIGRALDHVLDRIEASGEQAERARAVVEEATREMARLQGERQRLHRQAVELMAAERIDPAEVETLRAAGAALAGQALDVGSGLLLDLAEVLTPEQRRALADSWKERS